MQDELIISDIEKRFGTNQILKKISFKLKVGLTLLLGSNGAGKSTLLRIISGLMRPDAGHFTINDKTIKSCVKEIGYLGHAPQLYPHLTVLEQIKLRLSLLGASKLLTSTIQEWELENLSSKLCGNLSKGEQTKVALATAFSEPRSFLLIDEPTANLDEKNLTQLLKRIEQTKSNSGILIATHDVKRLTVIADRILILRSGNLLDTESQKYSVESAISLYCGSVL